MKHSAIDNSLLFYTEKRIDFEIQFDAFSVKSSVCTFTYVLREMLIKIDHLFFCTSRTCCSRCNGKFFPISMSSSFYVRNILFLGIVWHTLSPRFIVFISLFFIHTFVRSPLTLTRLPSTTAQTSSHFFLCCSYAPSPILRNINKFLEMYTSHRNENTHM